MVSTAAQPNVLSPDISQAFDEEKHMKTLNTGQSEDNYDEQ